MKIIPRFFHGVLDYGTGVILLLAPNLFGFEQVGGAAVWIPRIVGLMILLQALMTDYELGAMKVIPIGMHLMADYAVGALLFIAGWFFRENGAAMGTLIVMGLLILGSALMTQPRGRPREALA